MFERTVEEIKAGSVQVWVDQKQANVVGEFAIISSGWNALDFNQTLEIQRLCAKFILSAPKRLRVTIRSVHNSLSAAWGNDVGLPYIQ